MKNMIKYFAVLMACIALPAVAGWNPKWVKLEARVVQSTSPEQNAPLAATPQEVTEDNVVVDWHTNVTAPLGATIEFRVQFDTVNDGDYNKVQIRAVGELDEVMAQNADLDASGEAKVNWDTSTTHLVADGTQGELPVAGYYDAFAEFFKVDGDTGGISWLEGVVNPTCNITLLNQVNIVNSDGDVTDKLKIAKWENAFKSNSSLVDDFIEKDIDRFYVWVYAPSRSGEALKATIETKGDGYSDDATEITLVEDEGTAGLFKSNSQILVSNSVDDKHPVDGVEDNRTNDRTHIAKLGSSVEAACLELDKATATVPIIKTLKVTLMNYLDQLGQPYRTAAVLAQSCTVAEEVFAQIGVKVTWEIKNPSGECTDPDKHQSAETRSEIRSVLDIHNGIELSKKIGTTYTNTLSAEAFHLLAENDNGTLTTTTDYRVHYIGTVEHGGKPVGGVALAPFGWADAGIYGKTMNNVFISAVANTTDPVAGYILAHELIHCISNDAHSNEKPSTTDTWRLMHWSLFDTGGIYNSKRIGTARESAILDNLE